MKLALVILVILPLVFSAPAEVDKRWLVSLKQVEEQIKHLVTPETTEAGCEAGCKAIVPGLGALLCQPACHSLLHALHLDGTMRL